jgi:hypothetical protein
VDTEGDPTRKLVIVIDELDRCRPDYALQLLEIIKHFFNVPGVHFVLGVNLKELQNSVKARYGAGVDAETYLQKFISLQLNLPNESNRKTDWENYFDKAADLFEFPSTAEHLLHDIKHSAISLKIDRPISLRDVDRILSVASLIPNLDDNLEAGYRVVLSGLCVVKALLPENYKTLRASGDTLSKVEDTFDFRLLNAFGLEEEFRRIWIYISEEGRVVEEDNPVQGLFGLFGLRVNEAGKFIKEFSDRKLESFSLLDR